MLGTRPGTFPSLSLFHQVSRWGSRAPSCFDLCVEFFLEEEKHEDKIPHWIFAVLFSPMLSCRDVWRQRKKTLFFFLPHQRCLVFFLKSDAETLHHWGLLAWDLLIFTSGWIRAVPVRSPGVLWQAAPLAGCGVSPAEPNSSIQPARAHAPCQVTEWV